MARWYTRQQQRRYREERKRQAALVADRLMGKKKVIPEMKEFFGGTQMKTPVQYQDSVNFYNNAVRPSLVPWELANEVKR